MRIQFLEDIKQGDIDEKIRFVKHQKERVEDEKRRDVD